MLRPGRLIAALDALESAALERRREADRDENELASRIQALGADRSRLADELDGSLVKARRLERANREIAERLDKAIATIRSVLDMRRRAGASAPARELSPSLRAVLVAVEPLYLQRALPKLQNMSRCCASGSA